MALQALVVFITVPSPEVAQAIAGELLRRRLAACVNIVPGVRSLYHWEGRLNDDAELLLVVKTRAALFEALEAAVKAHHPYRVPEIIALPVVAGSAEYLAWIQQETQ